MAINLNLLNILLYSNRGKNLHIHNHIESEVLHSSFLFLVSMYFINAHSNMGNTIIYVIINIKETIITSIR